MTMSHKNGKSNQETCSGHGHSHSHGSGHGHSHGGYGHSHSHGTDCNGRAEVVDQLIHKLSIHESPNNNDNTSMNASMPPAVAVEEFKEVKRSNLPPLKFESYSSEQQLPGIMRLISKDLSEPYSIYTYRYFLNQWPNLCFLAFSEEGSLVGTIICKLDEHRGKRRGYIAMLAVEDSYRRRGIGSALVEHAVDAMADNGCDEVVLETEVTNKLALALYERLGFVADRRLFRYYLNGHDAFRLKLWLS